MNVNMPIFGIITDGQEWRFYNHRIEGKISEKCFHKIDLVSHDFNQLESVFINLLSKEKVQNGESKKHVDIYYEISKKNRILRESYVEAKKRTLISPYPRLPQSLLECVNEKGHEFSENEISVFLENILNKDESNVTSTNNMQIQNSNYAVPEIHTQNKSKSKDIILKVTINGTTFQETIVKNTLIKVIEFLGLERVKNNVRISGKFPIVIGRQELKNYEPYKYSQANENSSYLILTHSSTAQKKIWLTVIAQSLNEKIKIEEIPY